MNPDSVTQPTMDLAGLVFNQTVSLVVWFWQTYGSDFVWLSLISLTCILLLAAMKIFNLI